MRYVCCGRLGGLATFLSGCFFFHQFSVFSIFVLGLAPRGAELIEPGIHLCWCWRDWQNTTFAQCSKLFGSRREREIGNLCVCCDLWLSLVLFLSMLFAGCHLATQLVALLNALPPFLGGDIRFSCMRRQSCNAKKFTVNKLCSVNNRAGDKNVASTN